MRQKDKTSGLRILVAITGASGSLYAERLIEELLSTEACTRIYIVASKTGLLVLKHELRNKPEGFSLLRFFAKDATDQERAKIRLFNEDNFFAPVASSSSAPTHMVVLPCSMGCMARMATSVSSNLIERASDVMLKMRLPLIVAPRETPLHAVHLEHMLTLTKMGAHIVPLMPGFYHQPKALEDLVDFMVGRILELLFIEHNLYKPWARRLV